MTSPDLVGIMRLIWLRDWQTAAVLISLCSEEGDTMEENEVEEAASAEVRRDSGDAKKWKKWAPLLVLGLIAVIVVIWIVARFAVPKMAEIAWTSNEMVAMYIAAGVIGAAVAACLLLRKTLRTRLRMQKVARGDPDINDWLVVFDWTPKILYAPTIAASFLAAVLTWLLGPSAGAVIGGIWFGVFFLNFLIEEYNVSIKILLIVVVGLGCFLLWLHLLGRVVDFLRLFKRIAISMNATVYLLVGIIGLLAILASWLKGLFYYVTMTPNYMNLQEGPTESGEQIGREDYNSRVDTSDFLERLMGFGRIVITFKDQKRQPIVLLVWRIQKKAQLLEKVRAKFAIDHLQQSPVQTQ